MRKFLCIFAVSILATLAFQSVAQAQTTDCSGAAEQLQAEQPNVPEGTIEMYLNYVSDVGGCASFEGNTLIGTLSVPVYDPATGEELGIVKDLDPDLTSGEFAVTYEEFCGAFYSPTLTAQDYYDQQANAQERAILDPDGDGVACSGEESVPEDTQPIPEENPCADTIGYFVYLPMVDGCLLLEGSLPVVGVINSPVYDAGTVREFFEDGMGTMATPWDTVDDIGSFKELVDIDDMNQYVGLDLTYEEFCNAFPTPDYAGPGEIAGLSAQEYYDGLANDKERSILDPNGDGFACTNEDGAFLAGGGGESTRLGDYDPNGPCAGAGEQLGLNNPEESGVATSTVLEFYEELGGCAIFEATPAPFGMLYTSVYDPDTGAELGMVKDVDPNLSSGGFSVTHEEFCGAFPTPGGFGSPEGLSAQEYYEQEANTEEQAILDPNGDGLACTDEDANLFDETWNGRIVQVAPDGTESEFWVEADVMPISEMTEDRIGEIIGEVVLVGLDCGGVWILTEVNADYVVVEEMITEGTVENCVESVPITLTPQSDGSLDYYYLDMNGSVGEGVLTRRGNVLSDETVGKPSEFMRRLGMMELPDTGGASPLALISGLFLAFGVLVVLSRRMQ